MKATIKVVIPVIAFFGLAASSFAAYVDGSGIEYTTTKNEHGVIFKANNVTLYLGKSCDAYSPQFGRGSWAWANGGVMVKLEKKEIGFPHQDSPFEDGRCPLMLEE
ncbi:hypothetical protein [Candidatus Electrothrix sp.]|uniref:hypothetical protein n=1 Tax=Candidatus Electrothrix sp. TaxID=2170559 RepID=UPI0040560066